MAINWKWPGFVWLEHTGEESAKAFSYALFGAMMATKTHEMGAVNWQLALSQATFALLAALFGSVAALKITPANGTASFLPRVVAADKAPPK